MVTTLFIISLGIYALGFSGIIIFIILMAIAFIGYVLPWGQMSFWGATVITNLLSPFPCLIEWICGGFYISNPTLKRFFIFHFLLPFIVCGFIIIHLGKPERTSETIFRKSLDNNFFTIFFLIILFGIFAGIKYEVLIIMLFIVFLIFVFSEGLLFLSFFWVSCSLNWPDGIYVPDPCELTYTNTLLLSNAALSLGCAFICEEAAVDGGNLTIISFILAWTFISLQIKEFRTLTFYINDSIFGSVFFFLTGLHFFHVIVGIILISIILCIFPLTVTRLPIYVLPFHLYYNLQLIYWHFVELLWLFIYIIIYSY